MARRAKVSSEPVIDEKNSSDGGAAGFENDELIQNTTQIVSSFVANNNVSSSDLPALIRSVAETFKSIDQPEAPAEPRKPAVPVKKSVTPDYIVCLEDGKKLKMLKRHLRTASNMSPADSRERWGLPSDYPMVAPNYAKQRSKLAKKIGLGRR